MNMPLTRTAQSAPYAPTAAPAGGAASAAKPSPMNAALAGALWHTAMQMMKNAQQSGTTATGSALDKLQGGPGKGSVLQDSAAPASGVRPAVQTNAANGGFDFERFAELVRQLCNSAIGSGGVSGQGQQEGMGAATGDQVRQGADALPATAQAQAEDAPVNAAVEQNRMETIAILGRHEDKFKKAVDGKGIDKLINDKETPPDLVRALKDMKADPEMMDALDKAKTGKKDGKVSAEDINLLQSNSANKAFAEQKAVDFEKTYIPSDNKDPNAQPRPVTSNDAQRELFRYSDHLPKDVSRESLQKIVDGTAAQGKAPPQLVAAAKFYVDNPAAWEKDTGKGANESIRKDHLNNQFAKTMQLTAEEDKTLNVVDKNRDTFFGGGSLNDAKLKQIADDPKAKPEVRDAANALLDKKGSLLYTMLDNGKHGHGGNLIHAADDRSISRGDLDRVMEQRNKTIAPAETTAPVDTAQKSSGGEQAARANRTSEPAAARSAQAAQDMSDGQQNQPDAKTKKGGQLRDIGTFFLKAFSVVMNVASSVLSVLAKVPGLGLLAAPAAMAASGLSGAASVGAAALRGEDTKKAAMMAGIGMAGTAVGLIIPGGGKLVAESAKVTAREGAKEGAELAAKEGAKTAGTQGAKRWGQQEIVSGTAIRNDVVAREAGKAAGRSLGVSAATITADQTGLTSAASGRATNEVHAYQLREAEQRRLAQQDAQQTQA